MSVYEPASPPTPVEDVNRGTVVALITIPLGVIVFVIVWSFGFIASIISLGVAYLAMFLYQRGSGGVMGRSGAIRVTIITLVTLALSVVGGLIADVAIGVGQVTGVGPVEALGNPGFGTIFSTYVSSMNGQMLLSIGLAVLFGVIGCFGILRQAFRSTAAPTPVWPIQNVPPQFGAIPPQNPAQFSAPADPSQYGATPPQTFGTTPPTGVEPGTPPVDPSGPRH